MSLHSALSTLAGLLMLSGFVPYCIYVIKNRNDEVRGKPRKVSWIVWVFLDTVSLLGMFVANSVNMLSVAAVTGGIFALVLAFRFGKSGWKTLDKFCLVGGVLGVLLWGITSNPTVAIIASNMAVFVGAIPTFESVYKEPEGYFIGCRVLSPQRLSRNGILTTRCSL